MSKKLTVTKEELEGLYRDVDAVAIARMLGVTSGAVYARMDRFGIPRRAPGEYQKRYEDIPEGELIDLYSKHTQKEISELRGVSEEWVRKLLKKYGIKSRPRGSRREFEISKERLEVLYAEHSMREIAFMFGVGETLVFKRIKEHGIVLDENHRDRKGKTFSETHKANIQKAQIGLHRGDRNPNWQGGITPENKKGRSRAIYRIWKIGALKLAGNTCQRCGAVKGHVCECCGQRIILHVHHLKQYANHPELRYAPENAEVLCAKCHHEEHTKKTA